LPTAKQLVSLVHATPLSAAGTGGGPVAAPAFDTDAGTMVAVANTMTPTTRMRFPRGTLQI
jgi:hypothetical protein